jgi:uncharacterized tellurite resistance protein B-like protein
MTPVMRGWRLRRPRPISGRMIADILNRLRAEPESDSRPMSPEDCRLALSALMVRLARQDEHYTPTERETIEHVITERYGVDAAAARALREEAEALEAEASDTVRFTRLIKAAVPYEEREGVIEALWRVAITDGIKAEEHGFLRLVASLVGVSDVDSGLARQRAQRTPGED